MNEVRDHSIGDMEALVELIQDQDRAERMRRSAQQVLGHRAPRSRRVRRR